MRLNTGWHLAYCTNIHRGETWEQTFQTLKEFTLPVRDAVSPSCPYAIGLRLGDQAARELSEPSRLLEFQRWLEKENCYIFTINGFPYGVFHGQRVKEQVYLPDWTSPERLDYTRRLFDLLVQLLPPGVAGSVSTVPCSYKEFITRPEQEESMRSNLFACVEYIAGLSEKSGKDLHLGLEPEPLCYLETSAETVRFFDQIRSEHPNDARLETHLGVNYDTCHLAVEFEEPGDVLDRFVQNRIRLSKIHLSNAMRVVPTPENRSVLGRYAEDVYFHQVVARTATGLKRHRDLDVALASKEAAEEWRIHFHIPLHAAPTKEFGNTADHLLGVIDRICQNPQWCSHFEMETYTWEVMPPEMKKRNVVDQLVEEYGWTLGHFARKGILPQRSGPRAQ